MQTIGSNCWRINEVSRSSPIQRFRAAGACWRHLRERLTVASKCSWLASRQNYWAKGT